MKNITKILALTVLFTGLSLNAEVESKDNNLPEVAKDTRSEKVLKFAKDHKKKLIAGTIFAVSYGYGYSKTAKGPVWKKALIAPLVTPIHLSYKILRFIAGFNLKNEPVSMKPMWKNAFVGNILDSLNKPRVKLNRSLLAFLKS